MEETAAILHGITEIGHHVGPWAYFFDDEARAATDRGWLCENGWAGVISRHTTSMMAETCLERHIPLVDLSDYPSLHGLTKIRPANPSIGRIGAEHLLDGGFRNFAFCGYDNTNWSQERCAGFTQAIKQAGFPCIVHNTNYPGALSPEWDRSEAEKLAEWLKQLPLPTAIMTCHDMRALQLLTAANNAGLRVPEDVAILGVNNDTIRCELATPPLSSVATNPTVTGRKAAELLARIMAGDKTTNTEIRIEPNGVVVRRSSDVLAVPDKGVAAALRFIREHACEGINVDQVLPHAAMSRAHIEKKFREYLGRSPQAEIRRVQVLKIRQLLAETELPLKHIAELTGFEYMEYMSYVFKRAVGMAPGAYRRSLRS
jgi:LacI family transcriptional regulator